MKHTSWLPALATGILSASTVPGGLPQDEAPDPPLLEEKVREADDARYRLPVGWKVEPRAPGGGGSYLELSHQDEDGGMSRIVCMTTRSTSSKLPELVRSTLTGNAMGFELEDDDITVTETRQRFPVAYARAYNRPESIGVGVGVEGRAFAMKPKSDVHVILYISSADGIAEYHREDQLEAFIRELRFASAKEPMFDPLQPRESMDPLDLLVFTSGMSLMPNAFGGLDTDVSYDYFGFYPDGRYTELIPESGRLGSIDWDELAEEDPESIGVYRVRRKKGSNKGRLELTSVDEYGFLVELEGEVTFGKRQEGGADIEFVERLEVDGSSQAILEPAKGQRLRGSYTYLYGSSGSGAFSSGSISGSKTIEFKRTGSFEASSFFASSFSSEYGDTSVHSTSSNQKPATEGTYELSGFTLTLTYGDGTVAERFCHLVGEDEDLLLLDESPYLRAGRKK